MSEQLATLSWKFQGGFATDLAPETRELSFLVRALNVIYEVSGSIRKVGGANRINSSAIASGANITGMIDAHFAGTSGSFTDRFVALASDGTLHTLHISDGTTTAITGGATITANTVPVFAMLADVLTFWTSDNDTPLQITSSGNAATLTGSPPAARGAARYANRLFAYGDDANPSNTQYCAFGNPQIWTGNDTGILTCGNDDGDRIIGAIPYKGKLAVFKGPNIGSIYLISGRSIPEFRVDHLISGVPLQSPNSVVAVGDDVWFLGPTGVYSLAATEKFGNFEQADLTRFLKRFFREDITTTRMNFSQAVHYQEQSCVVFTLASAAGTEEDMALVLSYIRFKEEGIKASTWGPDRTAMSAAIRINASGRRQLVFGSTDGFVLIEDDATRVLPSSTAYTMRITTPRITILPGDMPATLYKMYLKLVPVGNYNVSVDVTRDGQSPQTFTFNQGQAGFILDTDALDTGRLGGGILSTVYPNNAAGLSGECRAVEIDITQGGASQDSGIYELGLIVDKAAVTRAASITI